MQVTMDDIYLWIGKLYCEKMQWEKAANKVDYELNILRSKLKEEKNDNIPKKRPSSRRNRKND